MKTDVAKVLINAVNQLYDTKFLSEDFEVFIHAEEPTSDYWGIWSWSRDKIFVITRHGKNYLAYECRDRTHARYLMLKMSF